MFPWELCGQSANGACQYPTFQLKWTVGLVIGAVFFGALVSLGLNCIFLLTPRGGKDSLQLRLLRGYVFALLLANTVYTVENFLLANFSTVFTRSIMAGSAGQTWRDFSKVQLLCHLTIVTIGALTDGLLVSGLSRPPVLLP